MWNLFDCVKLKKLQTRRIAFSFNVNKSLRGNETELREITNNGDCTKREEGFWLKGNTGESKG